MYKINHCCLFWWSLYSYRAAKKFLGQIFMLLILHSFRSPRCMHVFQHEIMDKGPKIPAYKRTPRWGCLLLTSRSSCRSVSSLLQYASSLSGSASGRRWGWGWLPPQHAKSWRQPELMWATCVLANRTCKIHRCFVCCMVYVVFCMLYTARHTVQCSADLRYKDSSLLNTVARSPTAH